MKKQILILAIFTLAIFAGTDNVFGQVLAPSDYGTVAVPLTVCVGDAQHPKAGQTYTYSFDTGSSATAFRWWATKDPDFVSADPTVTNQTDSLLVSTGELTSVSASYWGETATNGVDITWSADILGRTSYQTLVGSPGTSALPTSTFVVGWGTDGCTDNLKVWEIDPSPAFTVDITVIDDATMLPLAYNDVSSTQCVDVVRAAIYNAASYEVDYNFGWDTLYYEVVASNFVESWVPSFFLTGLDAGGIQTAQISWASSMTNAQAGTFIETSVITEDVEVKGTTALTASAADNSAGVSLIVQVVIANNNYETLAASTIGLRVAGEDALGFDIVDDIDCTQSVDAETAAVDDATTRTITERPTLDDATDGTPIILPVGAVIAP
jgi:hypothetical protein